MTVATELFKPMLAGTCKDINKLRYPILASPKLDGIRATVQDGRLMSRSLKPIPNRSVQKLFAGLPEGLDGELILGDPCAHDAYRATNSLVMSDDRYAAGIHYHLFDKYLPIGFKERLSQVANVTATAKQPVRLVQHVLINSAAELEELEEAWLELGHEGVMIRAIGGRYKEGRSTEIEGHLLKLKRFLDSEAEIIGTYELLHNANVATMNELGRTHRSSHQDNKHGLDTLGGLTVRDVKTGVEFNVGTGFDAATREDLWAKRKSLPGELITYKHFPVGVKDKPRHPVFKGFRDRMDT